MKTRLCTLLVVAMTALANVGAAPLTVCDFEDYAIGTKWTLWQSSGASTATVEADPRNANNKVLHIVLKDWGCHPEFALPTELRGKALSDRYPIVSYDLYQKRATEHTPLRVIPMTSAPASGCLAERCSSTTMPQRQRRARRLVPLATAVRCSCSRAQPWAATAVWVPRQRCTAPCARERRALEHCTLPTTHRQHRL